MSDEERVTLVREFPAELAEGGDGRTIDALIVPYGVFATVSDPPDFSPYQESFVPGAFERQTKAADRVKIWLNFEHEQGIRGIVGHGVELKDRSDGLYGSFRVHETTDGDKALQLVREGVLTGLSLEFNALRSRTVGGVTQRVRAHIDKVSLCMLGKNAFKASQVLAVRMEKEAEETAHVERVTLSPKINETLERIGFEPITRTGVVQKPWDGSADRFTDEEYERSCLVDRGGEIPAKLRCSLPVLEPDGELNVNALTVATSRLPSVNVAHKGVAARKLVRYYRMAEIKTPDSVRNMASR